MSKISHHNHRQFLNSCITLFFTLSLAACGGGGGGSDAPQTNNQPSASITGDNGIQILAEVSEVVLGTDDLTNTVDFSNPTVEVPINMSNPTGMSGATSTSHNALIEVIINNTPIGPETIDCYVSGTQKLWGDLADLNTLSVGDEINIDSNMCNDGDGEVIDGLMEMSIIRIEGDIDSFESLLEMDVNFSDLTITTDGESISFDGDISMLMDTLSPPIVKLGVSGSSFSLDTQDKTVTMSNFSDTLTVDTSTYPETWQQSAIGNLTSSEFTGSVNYEITTSFMGTGDGYPYTGELLVSDANGASLRLIVIDDENIQIDADYDGDNVVDETFNMTWAQLEEYS